MKNRLLSLSIYLLLTQPAFTAPSNPVDFANSKTTFSKIVFFGDSLSDNGNLYRDVLEFMPKDPPYFKGRFSNGQVWSDYVDQYFYSHDLVESTNYAIGGQTAFLHNPVGGYLPYTLAMSRENYVLHSVFTDRSSTLFVIWVGANDYLPGIKNIDQLTSDVTLSIKSTIEDLIYHGGVNFLLLNLPDLSSTPSGQASGYGDALKAATIVHNIKLDEVVSSLQEGYKNINIHLYDINHFFDDALKNTDEYNKKYNTHITNVTESCWTGGYTIRSMKVTEALIAEKINEHVRTQSVSTFSNSTKPLNNNSEELAHYVATSPSLLEAFTVSNHNQTGVISCTDPDDYMFWDKVHPTAVPHKIIGQELIAFIDAHYKRTGK